MATDARKEAPAATVTVINSGSGDTSNSAAVSTAARPGRASHAVIATDDAV